MTVATASEIAKHLQDHITKLRPPNHYVHPRQWVDALNHASNFNRSMDTTSSTSQTKGFDELLHMVSSLGDPPQLTVNVRLTIHADDRDIQRAGQATGTNDHCEALAADIPTFANA